MPDPSADPFRRLFVSRGILLLAYLLASGPLFAGRSDATLAGVFQPLLFVQQVPGASAMIDGYWRLFAAM